MVIRHNLIAANAGRVLGINTKNLRSTTEKLSSGYAINRASDDAAGLSISEKMRKQIRGLNQGARNIMDGISLLQVADGALSEVHDMLQRMNELSVQAANGTNSNSDRADLQKEISALTTEIDRIGKTTTFNEIKVFQGKRKPDYHKPLNGASGRDIFVKGKPANQSITDYNIQADAANGISVNGTLYSWAGIKNGAGDSLDSSIKNGIYSFTFNGMTVEIGVKADDTLEKIADDINGITFKTNSVSSKVKNITMGKTSSISLIYIDDEHNYVDLNHSGTCEIKADMSGITITNKKTNASTYLDFQDTGSGYTQSYEDLMNAGTLNNLTFEFYDTQYTFSLDLEAGWTKEDVIKALNNSTYDTRFGGNVADHYTTMPNGAGIHMNGFNCNFNKNFYISNGCDIEKLNIENTFTGSFIQDTVNQYNYSVRLEKDGNVNTFTLNQAGKSRLEAIGRNGCTAGESISLIFEDGNGNSIEAAFEATSNLTYASIASYLNNNDFNNLGNSIYLSGNFVRASDQNYDMDLSKKNAVHENEKIADGHKIRIQCSDAENDMLILTIGNMDAKTTGIAGLSVLTQDKATKAIDTVGAAINMISRQRSQIGAQQNRLEYSYSINQNTSENTQYAESGIRDADMAELMLIHSNENILMNVAQSMLAQANQDAGQVLNIIS